MCSGSKQHPEPWEFLVNCMAGISRSGVVGTFVQRVAGIPREHFITTNSALHPNRYVLKLLMVELHNREWPEWDGGDDGEQPLTATAAADRYPPWPR